MPRIHDSASNPHDFCCKCFPPEDKASSEFGDTSICGDGPDGRGNCFGWDSEHPAYEYEDYQCESCGKNLDENDN